ncbi:MAG TPA: DUF4402 domain-containing protein [Prolixibacteraceae bacterium]|jgi:hypothetical protein
MKNLFLIAIAVLGFSAISFGQVSENAPASATIVTPISIVKVDDMNFGNVAIQGSNDGTVVLTPAGGRTADAGATLPAIKGTVSAASFTVSGQTGYTYAITLPSTLTITSGLNYMIVDAFTSTPDATGTLDATLGTETISVGATLNVNAGQGAGVYTNTAGFEVTVNYN